MDRKLGAGTLRSEALAEIDKVKWDPAWGRDRIANMAVISKDPEEDGQSRGKASGV